MQSMVTVAGAENIATEALYVFIGEVQHNWDLMRRRLDTAPLLRDKQHRPANLVQWAVDHFTDDEAKLPRPSADADRAIAKGIFRFTLRAIQEDALNVALVHLKVELNKQKTNRLADNDGILLSGIPILYGFNRLMDNYWTPMQTGTGPAGIKPHSIDGSMLEVPDLPLKLVDKGTANPDDQLVQDKPGTDAT